MISTCSNLYKFNPIERCNYLLFGFSGVGKSSIVNSVASINSKVINAIANVREPSKLSQCTVNYAGYKFSSNVNMYDTMGLFLGENGLNYTTQAFTDLLHGRIPTGQVVENFRPETAKGGREINCVIFVFDEERLEKKMLKEIKKYYDIAKKEKKKCYAVITKMDDSFFKNRTPPIDLLEEDPEKVVASYLCGKFWESYVLKIHTAIDPELVVIPMINFTKKVGKTNKVIIEVAKSFVEIITMEKIEQKDPFFVDIFENEDKIILTSLNDPTCTVPKEYREFDAKRVVYDSLSDVRTFSKNFVFPRILYKCLMLGKKKFRFFLTSSLLSPETQIVGAFCRKGNSSEFKYFQMLTDDSKLEDKLKVAFDDCKHKGYYEFVTEHNRSSSEVLGAKFLRLLLKNNGVVLEFQEKEFPVYVGFLEHSIQMKKKIDSHKMLMTREVTKINVELLVQKEMYTKELAKIQSDFNRILDESHQEYRTSIGLLKTNLQNSVNELKTHLSTKIDGIKDDVEKLKIATFFRFSKKLKHTSVDITNRGHTAKNSATSNCHVCVLSERAYYDFKVKFKVDVMKNNYWISFGVIGTDYITSFGGSYSHTTSYGWSYTSQVWIAGVHTPGHGGWNQNFKTGDIVELELDSEKGVVSFTVEGRNQTYTIDIPRNKKYRINLGLYCPGDQVSIIQ